MAEEPNNSPLHGMPFDHADVEHGLNPIGRALVTSLDRAVAMQSSAILGYVHHIRRRNPEASPAEIQRLVDKHFKRLASGAGASAGAAAAIPGIGLATGTAAIAGESVIFLDTAAFYTMASAYLRGADIREPEQRRALILVTLLGAKGTAIVEALVGDLGDNGELNTAAAIGRFSAPKLGTLNNELMNMALRRVSRKFLRGWVGKIMPLGIGAAAGALANRRLAGALTDNATEALGPVPPRFLTPVPDPKSTAAEKKTVKARRKAEKASRELTDKPNRLTSAWRRVRGTSDDVPETESLTGDASEDEALDQLALTAIASPSENSSWRK